MTAVNFYDIAIFIFNDFFTFDDICIFEANFLARSQAEEFLYRFFHEIFAVDINILAERHLTRTHGFIFLIIFCRNGFRFAIGVIRNDDFDGVNDSHDARSLEFQIFADAVFKEGNIDHAVSFGHTDAFAEITDGFRCKSATADTSNGRHTGIVPAADNAFFDEDAEFALTHNQIRHIEAGKFNLPGQLAFRIFPVLNAPFIERTMVFKFESADRMGDPFNSVRNRMSKIIHRINAPFVTCTVMSSMKNTVDDRVTHVDIRACHINFGTQDLFAVGIFPGLHFFKQAQVFFDTAVAVRTFFSRRIEGTTVCFNLFACQIIDIGLAQFDQFDRIFINLIKII